MISIHDLVTNEQLDHAHAWVCAQRKKHSAGDIHGALTKVREATTHYAKVLKSDIHSYYDSIDHEVLGHVQTTYLSLSPRELIWHVEVHIMESDDETLHYRARAH